MSEMSTEIGRRSLRIMFDGVVALGPGHPDRGDLDGPFFCVMPRSTRRLSDRTQRLKRERAAAGDKSRQDETEEEPRYIPMHVPTLFTRMQPTDDSRPPDQVLQLSPVHDRWYLWHPVRERLEFQFDGDGTRGRLHYYRDNPVPFPEHHNSLLSQGSLTFHGIENVPDMRRIWPERGVLLDGLLSAEAPVSELVVTQVLVPHGIVAGAGVLAEGKPLDVVFDPPRGLDKHDSLVPNVAVIVDATTIEIASYSLDSGERLDSIKFQMSEGGEIWLSNGDPSDIEVDMEKLARQIAERTAEKAEGIPTKDAELFFHRFAQRIGRSTADRDVRAISLELYHNGRDIVNNGIARDHHRAGNIDLDFELFYTIMNKQELAEDRKGLPVPKRPRDDEEFYGPNCYVAICDTSDKLTFKSRS